PSLYGAPTPILCADRVVLQGDLRGGRISYVYGDVPRAECPAALRVSLAVRRRHLLRRLHGRSSAAPAGPPRGARLPLHAGPRSPPARRRVAVPDAARRVGARAG